MGAVPALDPDSYDSLVGKFVVTLHGQMLVERVDFTSMTAVGSLVVRLNVVQSARMFAVGLETILDSEVTEVDWRDPDVIERFLAGELIVDDVRLATPPAAEAIMCKCACGATGGCYRLGQGLELLAGHHTIPTVGCTCDEHCCWCVCL